MILVPQGCVFFFKSVAELGKIAKFSLKGLIVEIPFCLKSAYLAQRVDFLPAWLPDLPRHVNAGLTARNRLEAEGGEGSLP